MMLVDHSVSKNSKSSMIISVVYIDDIVTIRNDSKGITEVWWRRVATPLPSLQYSSCLANDKGIGE